MVSTLKTEISGASLENTKIEDMNRVPDIVIKYEPEDVDYGFIYETETGYDFMELSIDELPAFRKSTTHYKGIAFKSSKVASKGKRKTTNRSSGTWSCYICKKMISGRNAKADLRDHLIMNHFRKEIIDSCGPITIPNCPLPSCDFKTSVKNNALHVVVRHVGNRHRGLQPFLPQHLQDEICGYTQFRRWVK